MFWRLLRGLGVWNDEGYLASKKERKSRSARQEIIPQCVITVRYIIQRLLNIIMILDVSIRMLDQDTQAWMAIMMTMHLTLKQCLQHQNSKQGCPHNSDCVYCKMNNKINKLHILTRIHPILSCSLSSEESTNS